MRIMPSGAACAGFVGGISTSVCGSFFHSCGVARQAVLPSSCFILAIRSCVFASGSPGSREDRRQSHEPRSEKTARTVRLRCSRLEFDAVIQIEVAHARLVGHGHLPAVHVIFIAVDDGPQGLIAQRPAAGEHAIQCMG